MTEYDLKDIKIIKMLLVGIYYVMFLEKATHMLILVTCYIVMKNITYTSMTGLVIHSGKSPFIRSKFGQSLIKVFILCYLSAVNSKTNKMAELDLDSEKMF